MALRSQRHCLERTVDGALYSSQCHVVASFKDSSAYCLDNRNKHRSSRRISGGFRNQATCLWVNWCSRFGVLEGWDNIVIQKLPRKTVPYVYVRRSSLIGFLEQTISERCPNGYPFAFLLAIAYVSLIVRARLCKTMPTLSARRFTRECDVYKPTGCSRCSILSRPFIEEFKCQCSVRFRLHLRVESHRSKLDSFDCSGT
jgi:hypothetical protein